MVSKQRMNNFFSFGPSEIIKFYTPRSRYNNKYTLRTQLMNNITWMMSHAAKMTHHQRHDAPPRMVHHHRHDAPPAWCITTGMVHHHQHDASQPAWRTTTSRTHNQWQDALQSYVWSAQHPGQNWLLSSVAHQLSRDTDTHGWCRQELFTTVYLLFRDKQSLEWLDTQGGTVHNCYLLFRDKLLLDTHGGTAHKCHLLFTDKLLSYMIVHLKFFKSLHNIST